MDTRTYIPNEKRLIVALRYDEGQLPEADMVALWAEFLSRLDARFTKPTGLDLADGSFDWSLNPVEGGAFMARVRMVGSVDRVESLVPVQVVDDDTLDYETWLDGEIVDTGVLPPDGERNSLALANGHLTERIKELMNEEREDIKVGRATQRRAKINENDYRTRFNAEEGWPDECGILNCHTGAWVTNPTANPAYLCENHYNRRNQLVVDGFLEAVKPGANYIDYVDGDWGAAQRLENWMLRVCARCQDRYAAHYGEKCALGGGRFSTSDDFIGYNHDGNRMYDGDDLDKLYYNRVGEVLYEKDGTPGKRLEQYRADIEREVAFRRGEEAVVAEARRPIGTPLTVAGLAQRLDGGLATMNLTPEQITLVTGINFEQEVQALIAEIDEGVGENPIDLPFE